MITLRAVGLLGVCAAGCAVLAACGTASADKAGSPPVAAKVLTLTMANPTLDSGDVLPFVRAVDRLSHGTIKIVVDSGWRKYQIAYETGLIHDVQAGKTDLGVVGSRAWDTVGVNSFRALQAPLLINSFALQQKVLSSRVAANMLVRLKPLGLVGLGIVPGTMRYPVGLARPLLKPADYAGLRLGEQQSNVAAAAFRALGASAVPFAVGVPITRLDGAEQGYDNLGGETGTRHVTVTSNVVLWPRPLVMFASDRAYAKLTAAQRKILLQAARDAVTPATASERANDELAAGNLCRSGLTTFATASAADLASLRRAVQPVYAMLDQDPQNRRQIAQIRGLAVGVPSEPPFICRRSKSTTTTAHGALDGVWQFSTTIAQLKTVSTDPTEWIPENVGKTTVVVDRGRFVITQVDPEACTWEYGTIAVDGSVLTMTFINGGGIAPDGAYNRPGEYFKYRWSLYNGKLTVGNYHNMSPSPLRVVPWNRVSTVPTRSYFPTRCPPPAAALPTS